MDIKELKNSLASCNAPSHFLIFVNSENNFIATQYINAIAQQKELPIHIISSVEEHLNLNVNLFEEQHQEGALDVYHCKKFDCDDPWLLLAQNLIVVTDDISKDCAAIFANNIINIPIIEEWQIKDYAYSIADGTDTLDLDWLLSICKNDIYRIDQELQKISIFEKQQRKYIFKDFKTEGIFNDLSQYTIFNLTNALQIKDVNTVKQILSQLYAIDIEPIGLVTILYNNFKKMAQIWLQANPTTENTGIKSNQIWAIKKLPHNYSKEQLIKVLEVITSIDKKLKTGEIPVNLILDYLIINILSV